MKPIELLKFEILDDSEDPVFVALLETDRGTLQVMGEATVGDRSLEISGMHVGGDAAVKWGGADLRRLGRLVAEILDVDEILITGGVRTTGGNPGRAPKQWRVRRATST